LGIQKDEWHFLHIPHFNILGKRGGNSYTILNTLEQSVATVLFTLRHNTTSAGKTEPLQSYHIFT